VGDPVPAKEFAGYRLDGRVGRGGMGIVYRARDLSLDRDVALKVLVDELAKDAAFRRRFVAESKLAASLDHPNVIPIYAAGESNGMPYIAMRFVAGHDLRTILREEGRLDPQRMARLVAQVASALDAAHAHDLVHRDVKPANVLVTVEDHAYLTDFGLTKRVSNDTEATRSGMVLGTLNYMAPEQIRGQRIGPYTDVYSLGCMTVHLLTGKVPFPVDTEEAKLWAHIAEPPPLPSERLPELGVAFDPIVKRAMSKVPSERYASAGELAAALTDAAARGPVKRARSAPAAGGRRDVLLTALSEPFNVIVLAALLAAGIALDMLVLLAPLAVLVYAVAVARSYFDPNTVQRAAKLRRRGDNG
jgi:serine/threonine protein kinase